MLSVYLKTQLGFNS